MKKNLLRLSTLCMLLILGMMQQATAAEFKDFSVIVNNQTGTLLTADEQEQGTAVNFGVAVDAEGNTTRVAADDASSIATISGKYHSDHGCTGLKVTTAVPGPVTILIGKCTYSKSAITVTNSDGEKVIEYTPQGEQGSGDLVCWKNDRTNVIELTYTGGATTLTISGMAYCPFVAVKAYQEPAKWQDAYINLTGSLVQSSEKTEGIALSFGVAIDDNGNQNRVAADDASANVVLGGTYHDNQHGWTKFKAIVKVEGPVKIGLGNCTYGGHNANYTTADGTKVEFETTAECWESGNPKEKVTYIEYKGEATTLTINGAGYTPYFSIEKIELQPDAVENAATTATFPFHDGTEGQVADFGNMAYYFLSSKVTHGENLILKDKSTHADNVQTRFQPSVDNEKEANEGNAIKFLIRPYPGLKFTPKKVSLKSTRYGTDGGKLDFAWINPNGTTVSLATGQTANRNNTAEPSAFSYNIEGATVDEGECGLQINLYSLGDAKQVGFADIVIEGTLSGKKQEIPILTSFKANGETYIVDDIFEISGGDYVAEIELSKKATMISASNPVTDVTVQEGVLGSITYEGDDTKCKVTIPVTHNNITMNWIANFVQKPDYTLTYYNIDGETVLATQTVEKDAKIVEFKVDESKVTVAEGSKFRGWAQKLSGSGNRKFTVDDVITGNTSLFALVTPIEEATTTARFDYNFGDQYFYMEDHEMISSEGKGYWHDAQHGWAFQNGDKLKITMGGKGYIKMSLCQYSGDGTIKLLDASDQEITSIPAKVGSDGASTSLMYEGAAGNLTLAFDGVTYVHNLSIINMEETPYKQNGKWIELSVTDNPETNGNALVTTLEIVNGMSGTDRVFIYLPNGDYNLGERTLTPISRNNISLVGQSMDGVVIRNHPTAEGINITATILNTSNNLFMQNLTLKNELDYFNSTEAGRAVCLQDKGKKTICKSVKMLSYQDTYWSNGSGQFYWEKSEIHGVVDYMCGGGDVFYNECLLVNESRAKTPKNGSVTMTAPYANGSDKFGYVFYDCTVENLAQTFNFGRSWGGESKLYFINTTLNQPTEIAATRFTTGGMNTLAYDFHEYNSMDKDGNVVSPRSNELTFTHDKDSKTYETILTETEAAKFKYDALFTEGWDPKSLIADMPEIKATVEGETIKWDVVPGAVAYSVYNGDEFLAVVEDTQYTLKAAQSANSTRAASGNYIVLAHNAIGAYGTETKKPVPTAINVIDTTKGIEEKRYTDGAIYNLQGVRVSKPTKGIYIINGKKVIVK